MLLATEKYSWTAWHRAAEDSLETLETLWSWTMEAELHTDKLLLVINEEGETVLQVTAEQSQVE